MKFRIVEERSVIKRNDRIVAVPRFYVEMSQERFLFWRVWIRYINGFDTMDEAIDLKNAVQEEYHFKSRVINRS